MLADIIPPPSGSASTSSAAVLTIEAWLLKPADFDPIKKYPVGPRHPRGPQRLLWLRLLPLHQQLLATNGFLVVYSNPRGSSSYGRDFTMQVTEDWGGEDFKDLMAVVDKAAGAPLRRCERGPASTATATAAT